MRTEATDELYFRLFDLLEADGAGPVKVREGIFLPSPYEGPDVGWLVRVATVRSFPPDGTNGGAA